ncbi:S8 family serine peptidase [uncultured Prevotella sp.]|uniref:S8 family serine peptidase n=1 Tax=uncultured Prevotella sp. TaxID=159272 RepID=UPI0025933F99|nr:S8 family serine peptidase [uncultured Prevotella sp.]
MELHRIFTIALTALAAIPTMAQDRNNEDEVVKVDARFSAYNYREGEVIVKFKDQSAAQINAPRRTKFRTSGVNSIDATLRELGVSEVEALMPLSGNQQVKRLARSVNGKTVAAPAMNRIYLMHFDKTKVRNTEEAVAKLAKLADVEYAEPNRIVYALGNTKSQAGQSKALMDAQDQANGGKNISYDDPLFGQQWGLQTMKLPQLWQQPIITQKRPIIAILDTGVDIDHPDLKANIWTNAKESEGAEDYDDDGNGFKDDLHGWDFVNQTGRIGDWNGHGTHCAGIAAAVGGNGIGIVGANPDALIMPVTVMQSDGTGDVATIIKGIDYAVANGADIISMSFGSYGESKAEEQALGRAYQKAVLVAAAGNDGMCLNHKHPEKSQPAPMPMYPASYTFVLGVQAMNSEGNITDWSNYDDNGPTYTEWGEDKLYNYELLAPGVNIESTYPGGNYKSLNGTSMATPMVAGALSRLIQTKEYANKEYLFGDLINACSSTGGLDIYKVFSIKDEDRKPELSFVTYEMDDSTNVGDGDGRPDAGEVIDIYPIVRNSWGKAKNIKLSIELGENEDPQIVEFIKKETDFGSELSAYGKGKSAEPLRIKINDKCADNRHIRLVIKGTCDGMQGEFTQEITLTVENGVEIGGVIKKDMTLYPNVHYIVTKNLAISEGVTLTIKPGTKLEFKDTYFTNKGTINAAGKPDSLIVLEGMNNKEISDFGAYSNLSGFSYTEIKNSSLHFCNGTYNNIIFNNNFLFNCTSDNSNNYCCNIYNNDTHFSGSCFLEKSNIINNHSFLDNMGLISLDKFKSSNIWNGEHIGIRTDATIFTPDFPNYFGSSKEATVRKGILDINNNYGTTEYDLSNMLTRPNAEAHGVVWKVVVDGYDAQDEFDMLPPLGVGKHKFEVYFNRPMRTSVTPMVAMGVRMPYTQIPIAEEGTWSADSLIYTAYLTITGKTGADGLNRIYVDGAKDNEGFDIPYENSRFNVNVQAAGSLSTGFMGEAGLGKVTLSWNDVQNSFDDFLGYNLYRYTDKGDTIKVNKQLLDNETLEYVDYDVVPGTTYCYQYKVITTDLKETDPSNVVAVTPMTSTLGDANGSGNVDVADVITTVNYASGQNPKPFIFEAADVNTDLQIDILDVVGIIRTILNPNADVSSMAMATATYTVENGIVYVDSPVDLAGVQIQIATEKGSEVTATGEMEGFEQASSWLSDNDFIYLAYSMSGKTLTAGKHAILNIGNAKIMDIRLSDAAGKNVEAKAGELSSITRLGSDVMNVSGIYTLTGVKLSGRSSDLKKLPAGVYIVDGKKVVK